MSSSFIDASVGFPSDYVPVTPHNTVNNVDGTRLMGFYATVAGDIVVSVRGVDRTIPISANTPLIIRGVSLLKATGTTATGIFAIYL